MRVLLLLVAVVGCLTLGAPSTATAESYSPANVTDLIQAITDANGSADSSVINLTAGGTYTLTAMDNATNGNNGLPSIADATAAGALTINGNGATIERQSGSEFFRILHLSPGANLTLNNVNVTGGALSADGFGAGVLSVNATLTITGGSFDASGVEGVSAGEGVASIALNGGTAHLTMSNTSASSNGWNGVVQLADNPGSTVSADLTSVTIDSNGSDGLYSAAGGAGSTATATVTGGTAFSNDDAGMLNEAFAGGSASLTVAGTTITENDADGIANTADEADSTATATLTGVTLDQNFAGGLYSRGDSGGAAIVTMTGGSASDNSENGIFSESSEGGSATVTVTNASINDNSDDGIHSFAESGGESHAAIATSLIDGNGGDGLDIESVDAAIATMSVSNTTLSSNGGDGLHALSDSSGSTTVDLFNVSLVENSGGVSSIDTGDSGTTTVAVHNSFIARSGGGNCAGDGLVETLAPSLSDDATCTSFGFTAVTTAALDLGPLQDNGGTTFTYALGPESVALDAGDLGICQTAPPEGSAPTDQRGSFPRIAGATCDIGAFEAAEAEADLSITKTAGADGTLAGDALTYTIIVTNDGPGTATNVVVTDTLPEGVTFVEAEGCTEAGGIVTCAVGSLDSGQSASIDVTVTAPGERGSTTNTASVTSAATDPAPSNNTATVETLVVAPELHIAKDGPEVAPPGAEVVYAITVTNVGDGEARDVVITDALSGGSLTSVDAPSGVDCEADGDTVTCALDEPLQPGGEVVIWVSTVAPGTAGTTGMLNEACVTTATPGDGDTDNCDEAGTSVVADVPIPAVPPVGPALYQPEPIPSPSATETPEPAATATAEPTATQEPEPTATATSEPEPTATAPTEPAEPVATATSTPGGGAGAGGETPAATATPTPVRIAPMPPETGSGTANGDGTALRLGLLGVAILLLGSGALTVARRRA